MPSAPGKRGSKDTKVTDMLYDCYSAAGDAEALTKKIAAIQARYQEIIDGLGLDALSGGSSSKRSGERFEQQAGSRLCSIQRRISEWYRTMADLSGIRRLSMRQK